MLHRQDELFHDSDTAVFADRTKTRLDVPAIDSARIAPLFCRNPSGLTPPGKRRVFVYNNQMETENMKRPGILFWVSGLLTVIVLSICLHIEVLNYRDGGYLPVDFSGYPPGANRKWRWAFTGREHLRGLEVTKYRLEHGLEEDALIPPEAMSAMELRLDARIADAQAHNQLHDAVASVGLLQYLLCPASILCAAVLACKKRDRLSIVAGSVFAAISMASCIMMFYRGYFASLGW